MRILEKHKNLTIKIHLVQFKNDKHPDWPITKNHRKTRALPKTKTLITSKLTIKKAKISIIHEQSNLKETAFILSKIKVSEF